MSDLTYRPCVFREYDNNTNGDNSNSNYNDNNDIDTNNDNTDNKHKNINNGNINLCNSIQLINQFVLLHLRVLIGPHMFSSQATSQT